MITNIMAGRRSPEAMATLNARGDDLPPDLLHLISPQGALHHDPEQRIKLDEVVRSFPLRPDDATEQGEAPKPAEAPEAPEVQPSVCSQRAEAPEMYVRSSPRSTYNDEAVR